jgi:hypothetical protein
VALILVASILLVIVLLIASAIDYKTHKVNDFMWIITFAVCTLIMVQTNLNASLLIKTQIVTITIGYILLTYLAGDLYYELKFYGGADVKFAMAVSVLLASFGFIGTLFYIWFLVLYPLFIFISLKVVSKEKRESTINSKFAFIPYMTVMFLGICLIHILSVN